MCLVNLCLWKAISCFQLQYITFESKFPKVRQSIIVFFLLFIQSLVGYSQVDLAVGDTLRLDRVIVDQVILVGNRRTKSYVIQRELTFNQGDTLLVSDTNKVFSRTRDNVFNTGLFVSVKTEVYETGLSHYILVLKLKERWYSWPIPILELADRNFNEWVEERGADWKRINIGVDFKQENFRGRNEQLRVKLQTGFTKKYELFYTIPYVDTKRKSGLQFAVSYSTNKIVAHQTFGNKLLYHDGEQVNRKRFYSSVAFLRRGKLYSQHKMKLRFNKNSISDTIKELNSAYFQSGNNQRYFELIYTFTHDKRDIKYYARKGHFTEVEGRKLGLGLFGDVNQFDAYLTHSRYLPLTKKLFFSAMVRGKYAVAQKQNFFNNKAMGYYEDFVRGYELYAIDGQKYILNRNELKLNLLNKTFHLEKHIGSNQFSTVPLQIYLKSYADFGWVKDTSFGHLNPQLNDKLLSGVGVGLDFVTFYDAVIRLEYSYNQLNEHGFFLHIGASI